MTAMESHEFCESHLPLPHAGEAVELPFVFRLVRRVGAALLLALFLLQLYVRLRMLYEGN